MNIYTYTFTTFHYIIIFCNNTPSQYLHNFVIISKVKHHGVVFPSPGDGRAAGVSMQLEAFHTHTLERAVGVLALLITVAPLLTLILVCELIIKYTKVFL